MPELNITAVSVAANAKAMAHPACFQGWSGYPIAHAIGNVRIVIAHRMRVSILRSVTRSRLHKRVSADQTSTLHDYFFRS